MSATLHRLPPRNPGPVVPEPLGYLGPRLTVGEWICAIIGVGLGAACVYIALCAVFVQ